MKHVIGIIGLFSLALVFSSAGCAEKKANRASEGENAQKPVQYTYRIVNSYPHDTGSYTQGLYWHDGYLWEGTGQRGESRVIKVELETGRAAAEWSMDPKLFGEGIARIDGKIYQLTWSEGRGFIYDEQRLEPVEEFTYGGEGWGLTTDGKMLYMSDGSDRIYVVEPDGFVRRKIINVTMNGRRVLYLNELEWIDGLIWANVYTSDAIVMIEPETGNVVGVVDLTGILPASERTARTDVLNGIAYDEQAGRIFVTGKYWSRLFEIELIEKQ